MPIQQVLNAVIDFNTFFDLQIFMKNASDDVSLQLCRRKLAEFHKV